MSLNDRQRRFAELIVEGRSATQAYKDAGYSPNGAGQSAGDLLKNPDVLATISDLRSEAAERAVVSVEYVLANLKEIVERCMERAPVMVREGREMVQATDEEGNHVWQFDSRGATAALNLAGKQIGMFVDRHEDVTKMPADEREKRVLTLLSNAKRRKSAS